MRFYDEENTSEILSAFDAVCEGLFFFIKDKTMADKLMYTPTFV